MSPRVICAVVVLLVCAFWPIQRDSKGLRVGSKKFTESVILGELLTQLARETGTPAEHKAELGGSSLLFRMLQSGDIDLYTDYTGTISKELLDEDKPESIDDVRRLLAERGVLLGPQLGFDNSYALGMKLSRAQELGISRISDLARHPDLRLGFTSEFMQRSGDGWPFVQRHYGLPQTNVQGMDHDIAYRQLEIGAIDVMDVYTTDAKISLLGILALEDDLQFFDRYDAVILMRDDLSDRFAEASQSMLRLENAIDRQAMTHMNALADAEHLSEVVIARDFLREQLSIASEVQPRSRAQRLWQYTLEHVDLVRKSLIPAILVGVLLCVLTYRNRWCMQAVMFVTGVVQTVPSLALLVLLLPLVAFAWPGQFGSGVVTATIALFLYSLLPIVRNTYTGLRDIDPAYLETADALGLPLRERLRRIELPLASRTILSGIKTAAILNIGFATLGALIGAGGYGAPVLTGIRRFDEAEILLGALPAAAMALLCQIFFDLLEKFVVPRGLQLNN